MQHRASSRAREGKHANVVNRGASLVYFSTIRVHRDKETKKGRVSDRVNLTRGYELGINKDRYKSLADEMDSTFAELAGY
ncbi:Tropomyosin-1 [Frankliniella fusca]|uniref:Tropomyosin-1 n=1 Tax=Frankliniella fusca TaxID=407009 RepID=A0AAE1HDE0_9NEOP|nr:Tropomyosin-1 [Frankliniella fusca]